MIAAFAQYLQVVRGDQTLRDLLLFRSAALLRGVIYYIAEQREPGVPGGRLRDWYDTRSPDAPGGDPGNYHTGSGVFWRCIQHVYDLDPDFRKMIGGLKNFRDLLAFNADLACDNTHKVLPEHIRSPTRH